MAYANPNILPESASTFEGGTHTWVTTGGNTTLAVVSGQFLSGTQSLRATPTAAGSIEAISPRWAVTAGKEYVCRLPLRTSAATTGRTITARITWFDDPTGGSSLGVSDATLNVSNQSGWFSANYPVSIGTAPVGAQSATLKMTVTGLAAGEYVNTDDVHAGEAKLLTGNLLGFNVQSIEKDTSGYSATNATLARTSAILETGAGFYALGATSVASGEVSVSTASFTTVTAGVEYVAYALVNSSTAAVTSKLELQWYNSSDTLISQETRSYTATQNVTTRLTVVGKAPSGAVKCKVYILPQATAASQVFTIEQVTLAIAPNVAGNLLSYDEYSTESSLPSWTVTNTSQARAFLTSGVTDGYYAVQLTPVATGLISMSLDRLVPTSPGVAYQLQAVCWRRVPTSVSATSAFRTRIDWYDSGGGLFQSDNPDQFYPKTSSEMWLSHITSETRTCPEGASYARVVLEIDHSSSMIDAYFVDNVKLVESTPEYELVTSDEAGVVTLTVNSIDTSAETVTIRRMDENGEAVPVRGYGAEYVNLPYAQTVLLIEDYEAPLSTKVWYAIEWFGPGGVQATRLFTQTITTPVLDDPDYVWFKSPGLPAMNTRVLMENPISWARAARSSTYEIVGRRNPVHITGTRGGRTSSLSLLIWDEPSHELFNSLLDSGLPSLIQAMPGYGVHGNLYLSVGDVESEPVSGSASEPGWRWTVAVSEIDRPSGGLQGSSSATWQDIYDNYETWFDVFDAHESWVTVLTEG